MLSTELGRKIFSKEFRLENFFYQKKYLGEHSKEKKSI